MNNKKYKDTFYEMREINDLKDMVNSSAELFAEKTAYFIKERPGGKYMPISYKQVKNDVDCLGTGLIKMGLKDKKVAVIGENSYDWVISYLATVCGTGVIVPLDRELPENELIHLIKRAEISAIVYSKKMEKIMEGIRTQIENNVIFICMSEDHNPSSTDLQSIMKIGMADMTAGNRSFLDAKIDREVMCSLLFTSGTTGLAKGVMLSHKNITSNIYNMSKYVKIDDDGVGLSVLPMHHSYEMTCHIFTSFYQGIAIAICEGLKYILKNMAESRATVMLGVPLVFENMHKKIFKQAEQSGKLEKMQKMIKISKKYKLYNNQVLIRKIFKEIHQLTGGNMRLFIAGGAAINPKIVEDFQAMGFPMIQGYGMTENAPIIAVNRDKYSRVASVGPPMPGTEIKIVDADQSGIGEIILKGPSVMLGYYGNQEATDEAIRDGWLYTGDYGYIDKDGFVYVSGRKKDVIVTKNGKNIFPEEVEYYLIQNEYIEEAVVHGVVNKKTGDTVVKAELFPNYPKIFEDLGNLTDDEIERFMKRMVDDVNDEMPAYKRVVRIGVRKVEFEKTTTRKIKRHTVETEDEN